VTVTKVRSYTLPTPLSGQDWRHRGPCRDEDPETFFPIGSTGPAAVQIQQAKAICAACPVTAECLSWALDVGEDHGVWGGLSEHERRKLRQRGLAAQHRAVQRAAAPPPPRPVRAARRTHCAVCGELLQGQQWMYCSRAHARRAQRLRLDGAA
jgi:WhiB family redox-sensing transcriptional regulator